jgi:hypothetical protein
MPSNNLKPGDPLVLTLAADARLGPTSYIDDHIWELNLSSGEPPSLAIQTTFGMRARSFRIFPRFILQDTVHTDPSTFIGPVHFKYLAPNFMRLACTPFPGINVEIEYWVPTSQNLAGRTKVTNTRPEAVALCLDWVALLTPDSAGQRMAPLDMGLAHLLAGRTSGIAPVFLVAGLVQPGAGPYTSLATQLVLSPHEPHAVTWVESALPTPEASFAQAQQITALNWDAETARIELVNASQLEIHTGSPDWDAALCLSQKTARGLILANTSGCPHPSTVSTRLPDQGYSLRGDGSDYTHLWDGQTLFDLYYLFDLLMPGEPELVRGFLENFLASQAADGSIPRKRGLSGQLGKQIAPPLLATLVWRYVQLTEDNQFLHHSFPHLLSHLQSWFSPQHDRDGDGIPEWDHPLQTGYEDHPVFAHWHPWSQGWDISTVECPDLCAYLHTEIQALIEIAPLVNRPETIPALTSLSEHLVAAVEASWDESSATYQAWDRESHHTASAALIAERQGPGIITASTSFEHPVRLLIRLRSKDETTRPAQGFIHGTGPSGGHRVERISPENFRWHLGVGRCTSERIYSHLEHIEIQGILDSDQVTIETPNLNCREQSTLLPLWAGIPSPERAKNLIKNTVTNRQLFWGKYGLRACAEKPAVEAAASHYQCVHPLWNTLVGEGLLRYGKQLRAAELVTRMMEAIVANLKQKRSFFSGYLATSGQGVGERNSLLGLAPLGLFLHVLGVQIITPYQVKITASNPFPWPVTVKYKGLTVIQQKKKAMIIFPDGQNITVRNEKPQMVSLK